SHMRNNDSRNTDQQTIQKRYALFETRTYIKVHLGGVVCAEPTDTEVLQTELADLQQKLNLLMEENKELRNKLLQYEPSPEEGAPQQPEGVSVGARLLLPLLAADTLRFGEEVTGLLLSRLCRDTELSSPTESGLWDLLGLFESDLETILALGPAQLLRSFMLLFPW
ncbi:hypothetical protein CCH79_00017844, partial [Gambusia affinis]